MNDHIITKDRHIITKDHHIIIFTSVEYFLYKLY